MTLHRLSHNTLTFNAIIVSVSPINSTEGQTTLLPSCFYLHRDVLQGELTEKNRRIYDFLPRDVKNQQCSGYEVLVLFLFSISKQKLCRDGNLKPPVLLSPTIPSLFQKLHIPFALTSALTVHSELFQHLFPRCHLASPDGWKLAYSPLVYSGGVNPAVLPEVDVVSRACTDSIKKNLQGGGSQHRRGRSQH